MAIVGGEGVGGEEGVQGVGGVEVVEAIEVGLGLGLEWELEVLGFEGNLGIMNFYKSLVIFGCIFLLGFLRV